MSVKIRQFTTFGLVAILAAVLPATPAQAAVWGESIYEDTYEAVDGHQIPEERLTDHIVEYDELGSLIHANNATIQELTDSKEENRQSYAEIRDYLTQEMDSARRKRDDAKDDGDMDAYAEYASLVAIYQGSAKSYNTMMQNLDKKSSNSSRVSQEKQLTSSVQSLMISYESLRLQKENLEKTTALYEEQYRNALTQQSAGLATGQEVSEAYNNWLAGQVSLDSVSTSLESLYNSLCSMLGLETDGSITIGRLPEPDTESISGISLEEDIQKAIGNNTDLISIRSDSSDASTAGSAARKRSEQETEEELRIKLTELYETMGQAKASLEAAKKGYQAAQITWNTAQSRQSLGMLSRAEYLQEEISYLQKKSSCESAQATLTQAMQEYDWAVRGIVTL